MGIDPPEHVTPKASLEKAEERDGWGRWVGDLYGFGEGLRRTRAERGWEGRFEGQVEAGVRALLDWEGGETGREVYEGALPW